MSFPAQAASVVNCSPVTCMPSPESPAKRITARVSVRRGFAAAGTDAIVSLMSSVLSSCQASHTHPYHRTDASVFCSPLWISLTQDGADPPAYASQGNPSDGVRALLHANQRAVVWQGYPRSDRRAGARSPPHRSSGASTGLVANHGIVLPRHVLQVRDAQLAA